MSNNDNKLWQDITSHRQGVKPEDREVRTVEYKTNDYNFRLIVTRHMDYGENFILRCPDLGINEKDLHTESIKIAKDLALMFCLRRVNEINAALWQLQ